MSYENDLSLMDEPAVQLLARAVVDLGFKRSAAPLRHWYELLVLSGEVS